MLPETAEFIHLQSTDIISIHALVLKQTGGAEGKLRPPEAIMGTIFTHLAYEDETRQDLFQTAALYAKTIACGHFFVDGNKRTALASMATFLALNGFELKVAETELADQMIRVVTHKIDQKTLGQWLKNKITPVAQN